jgi:hypothetical protein
MEIDIKKLRNRRTLARTIQRAVRLQARTLNACWNIEQLLGCHVANLEDTLFELAGRAKHEFKLNDEEFQHVLWMLEEDKGAGPLRSRTCRNRKGRLNRPSHAQ